MSAETRTTSSTGGQKGVKLERFDLIPVGPLTALATHFGRGAAKYDDNQWRKGYEWSKSYAAKQRHDNLFWAGFDYDVCENDPEGCAFVDQHGEPVQQFETEHGHGCYNHTTSHHLDASNWHGFVLREFTVTHPEHDDRFHPAEPELDLGPIWTLPDGGVQWRDPEPPSEDGRLESVQAMVDAGLVGEEQVINQVNVDPPHFARQDCEIKFTPFDQADLQPYLNEIKRMVNLYATPHYFIVDPDGDIHRASLVEYVNAALNRRD